MKSALLSKPSQIRLSVAFFIAPVFLLFFLFVVFSTTFTFPVMKEKLLDGKKHLVKEQTRIAESIIKDYDNLVKSGKLSLEEAQEEARENLRRIRFGEDGKNYFFIIDTALNSVMHPLRQSLEGTSMKKVKDKKGNYFIANLVLEAIDRGEGYTTYYWYRGKDKNQAVSKLSYVMHYEPWGWVFGTGIFIDDVDEYLAREQKSEYRLLALFGTIALILSGIIIYRGIASERQKSHSEERLQESEEHYRDLFNSSRDGLLTIEAPHWNYTLANPAACKLFGVENSEEFKKLNPMDLSPEFQPDGSNSAEKALSHINDAVEKGTSHFEWVHKRLDGSTFWASVLVSRHERAGNLSLLGTIRDITPYKEATLQLQESEENLRITLNSIGDAVISTDKEGRVVSMNAVASGLTGWKVDEAVGEPLSTVFQIFNADTKEAVETPFQKVMEKGQIVGLANHTILRARNGDEHQISDSGAPIRNSNGDITGVVLVCRDMTKEYQLEEQFREAQKMEAVGKLAGGVAHDFNNLIGAIMSATELLQFSIPAIDPKSQKFLDMILGATDNAANLTKKLLAFSRKSSKTFTSLDVHDVLTSVAEIFSRTFDRKIEIQKHLDADKRTITGDISELQNACMNLGINASHAMEKGGVLTINTHNIFLDDSYCEKSSFDIKAGEYIVVVFQDNGTGIAAQNLNRIFDPFFTTKEQGKGTGLGLAAVYGIIKDHSGEIEVSSEEGKGTTFVLYLPLSSKEEKPTAPQRVIMKGKGKILLVDDDPFLRITGETILKQLGYDVLLAEDGIGALEIYKKEFAGIDLIILDMIMPKMNGKEAFLKMKEINPECKVILATGFSSDSDFHEMDRGGLSRRISKPFKIDELSLAISEVLNS